MNLELVPNAETAISIASCMLKGIGYDAREKSHLPLNECETKVLDEGEAWVVAWLPLAKGIRGGGTPFFRIAKKDGQVRDFHFQR